MQYKFEYTTKEERESIIVNNTEKTLLEEQNLVDGNFLIYTDTPIIKEQINSLKSENLDLKKQLNDANSLIMQQTQQIDNLNIAIANIMGV